MAWIPAFLVRCENWKPGILEETGISEQTEQTRICYNTPTTYTDILAKENGVKYTQKLLDLFQ